MRVEAPSANRIVPGVLAEGFPPVDLLTVGWIQGPEEFEVGSSRCTAVAALLKGPVHPGPVLARQQCFATQCWNAVLHQVTGLPA